MAQITSKNIISSTLFFELIQVSIGNKDYIERKPSDDEWSQLYILATRHSLVGVLLTGLEKTILDERKKPSILFEWIGVRLQTESLNKLQRRRTCEIFELFKHAGYSSCVLKGQGTSLYYPRPDDRQCGDIDIWVEGDRDKIIQFLRSKGYRIGNIDIKHADVEVFEDVPVEVHFQPSWMYSPLMNKRLNRFFNEHSSSQFLNYDNDVGFAHTTVEFDLVFSIVHIYRHIFSEGIGLRQLMDYYFILIHSNSEQRTKAFTVLASLKMTKFVGGIMWILRECFGIKEEYMLCSVNERHGKYLLAEILTAGNFGKYDDRMLRIDKEKRFERGLIQLKRNLRFVSYYPSEVLWSPFWKLWHWGWRKRKGYL